MKKWGIILSLSMLVLASISVVACSNGPSASTEEQIKVLTARVTSLESQIGNFSSPIKAVSVISVGYTEAASAAYDPASGSLTLRIPQGQPGQVGAIGSIITAVMLGTSTSYDRTTGIITINKGDITGPKGDTGATGATGATGHCTCP